MRGLLLAGLAMVLAGCPTTSTKSSSKKPTRKRPTPARLPAEPGAFPSLVTSDTFALAPRPAKKQAPEVKPPRKAPRQGTQAPTKQAPPPKRPDGPRPTSPRRLDDDGKDWKQHRAEVTVPERQMLDRLTATWQRNPQNWFKLASLLLYLLSIDRPMAADRLLREKDALSGYEGNHFELNMALAMVDRRLARSSTALERLRKLARHEGKLAPLLIGKAVFAAGPVPRFGGHQVRRNSRFRPGDLFRVYVEVDNFVLSGGDGDQYNVRFKARMWLVSASGRQYSPGAKWLEPQTVNGSFRSFIKDIWMPFVGQVPTDLPAGDYDVVVELEDLNKQENQRATKRLTLTVSR